MIAGVVVTGLVGILCAAMGWLIWKKGRIDLLHSYHYDRVSREDRQAFCALSGKGVFAIGAGLLASAALLGLTESGWSFLPFAAAFIAGIGMNIQAGRRHNR